VLITSIFSPGLLARTAAMACSGLMPNLMPTTSRKLSELAVVFSDSALQQSVAAPVAFAGAAFSAIGFAKISIAPRRTGRGIAKSFVIIVTPPIQPL
jgi:hypothetical protein